MQHTVVDLQPVPDVAVAVGCGAESGGLSPDGVVVGFGAVLDVDGVDL